MIKITLFTNLYNTKILIRKELLLREKLHVSLEFIKIMIRLYDTRESIKGISTSHRVAIWMDGRRADVGAINNPPETNLWTSPGRTFDNEEGLPQKV